MFKVFQDVSCTYLKVSSGESEVYITQFGQQIEWAPACMQWKRAPKTSRHQNPTGTWFCPIFSGGIWLTVVAFPENNGVRMVLVGGMFQLMFSFKPLRMQVARICQAAEWRRALHGRRAVFREMGVFHSTWGWQRKGGGETQWDLAFSFLNVSRCRYCKLP